MEKSKCKDDPQPNLACIGTKSRHRIRQGIHTSMPLVFYKYSRWSRRCQMQKEIYSRSMVHLTHLNQVTGLREYLTNKRMMLQSHLSCRCERIISTVLTKCCFYPSRPSIFSQITSRKATHVKEGIFNDEVSSLIENLFHDFENDE